MQFTHFLRKKYDYLLNAWLLTLVAATTLLVPRISIATTGWDAQEIIKKFAENFKRLDDPKQKDDARLMLSIQSVLSGVAPEGTPEQAKTIVALITKAANVGVSCASYSLGELYYNGYSRTNFDETTLTQKEIVIVPKDREKALELYTKSANGGCPDGQRVLGWSYATGDGVLENNRESFNWYEKAALNGQADSAVAVALAYYAGKGVTKDKVKALAWLILSEATSGTLLNPKLQDAIPNLKKSLKESLSQNLIQKAQDLALSLQKKIKSNQNNFKG